MKFVNYTEGGEAGEMFLDSGRVPEPGPQEVCIEVRAFGVNRADLLQRLGKYPPPAGASPILGLECSGVVVKTGVQVENWKQGDEVTGLVDGGAYAEYCVMDAGMIWRKPRGLSWAEAAALPEVFLTAFQALYLLGEAAKRGSVLIHAAASGVGTAAIQLLPPGTTVWGTVSAGKMDFCRKMGYDHLIDYRNQSFREVIQAAEPAGVDLILDFIGGSYFEDNVHTLAMDGCLVMLGLLGGGRSNQTNISPVISRRLRIVGSTLRSRSREYKRDLVSRFTDRFETSFTDGSIHPVLYDTVSWENIGEAHRMLHANETMGKVVAVI